jgi:hypothetical protein
MKADIKALVARFNGKAISYEGINDSYTTVQLCVKKADLDEATIEYIKGSKYIYDFGDGFNLGEHEAKDYPYNYGESLTVSIETFEINIPDVVKA